MNSKPKYINLLGSLIDLSVPKVMGIINVTPDSFYKGSRHLNEDEILAEAEQMLKEGADILDVGGYSTRPGAEDVPPEEERLRVMKAIRLLTDNFPGTAVSIDTFRSQIAAEAVLDCGAGMINDVSGGEADKDMFDTVVRLGVPYVLMHMQGTPATMQLNPVYSDVVADVIRWLGERVHTLQSKGAKDIIVDPGFGFGKTIDHNFEILCRLNEFSVLQLPLLAGLSRKSMIWKTLGTTPEQALNGTTALNAIAILNGADIIRVHDVAEAVQAVKLASKVRESCQKQSE
ncbi:MAG: dihydropteroate synthase [Bacteroidales bacterium]|nr:dihydropteroate synthase [Bacteroidales bacterium]